MALSHTLLGDVRAELDTDMLERAFLQTPDYQTVLTTVGAKVVVGRRGAGKSALQFQLSRHWAKERTIILITIAPTEEQIIGVRPVLASFGNKFTRLRAAAKLAWRYTAILEVLDHLSHHYKLGGLITSSDLVATHLKRWRSSGQDIVTRLRNVLKGAITPGLDAEEVIGNLASILKIRELEIELRGFLEKSQARPVILVDRLDEGYESDTQSIAFIDGAIYGLTDFCAAFAEAKAIVFLRDNIFRAIAHDDPDFSRNVEGQALRLHWDTYQLFNLVCNRLRVAFSLEIENNQRLWDRCTANELQRQDGFKRCLQLTLYRPRDIIILLNQAFFNAGRQSRDQIILGDIETSAKQISASRLADLHKEYTAIFPAIHELTNAYLGRSPEATVPEATALLSAVITKDEFPTAIQQDFALFRAPEEQLQKLYSVGFIGIHDQHQEGFKFCHDGSQPDQAFRPTDRLLVHPCYWLALNLTRNTLNADEAETINDEYEITITSQTPQIRSHKLGQLISELDKIPHGDDGAKQFEEWCEEVVRIVFAGKLRNVQLHPNRNATQRRDVVGTNLSTKGTWERIYNDYKTRQVIFEIKNYKQLGLEEYRQMLSYLCDDYGKAGFIVTRDDSHNLTKGADLDHFLEMYHKHGVTIIKLTARYLCTMLSKLRNPQKHDEPDNLLSKLLDTYSRQYLSGVAEAGRTIKRKTQRG